MGNELSGEREAHERHLDPRRAHPGAHRAACEAAIASGRQLVGWEEDKPALIAELRPVDGEAVLVDRMWVPVAYRSRQRLVGGVLYHARQLPALAGRAVLLRAGDAGLAEAAKLAGFMPHRTYRHIVLRG